MKQQSIAIFAATGGTADVVLVLKLLPLLLDRGISGASEYSIRFGARHIAITACVSCSGERNTGSSLCGEICFEVGHDGGGDESLMMGKPEGVRTAGRGAENYNTSLILE